MIISALRASNREVAVSRSVTARLPVSVLLLAALVAMMLVPFAARDARGETAPDHLVISEIVTGGASASDELIELYNPTAGPLPLEGLELVYVSASGATVSRRAAWDAGAPSLGAGRHLLVANELGTYASIADAVYASGMAAAAGSVALRIQGASSAIDAVGWGTAVSTWLEGTPASAPPAGSSLERLPGGAAGSTRDTDDNAADLVERSVPDPQNTASPPVPDPALPSTSPTASVAPSFSVTASPTESASPTADPTSSPTGTASPNPAVVSVAKARALPDGSTATIEATALSGSGFTEGGGYVADDSTGLAVLLSSGSFERGARVRITGTIDDRFAQRTLRSTAAELVILGTGTEPGAVSAPTGSVTESLEGSLARVAGTITGSPSALSSGLAFELDDGSGAVRVLVGPDVGIDTSGWDDGTRVEIIGLVGQRDSSGTGTGGYRVQPRDAADVLSVEAATPTPDPSASPGPSDPDASPTPSAEGVRPIADARKLPRNARVTVRGTVTMVPGVVDPVTAVIQDESGAILLRVGEEVGPLALGERVQVDGMRSTLRGMETLRVTAPAARLGTASQPQPAVTRTADAGEELESRLITVRGALVAAARRAGSGSVSFEIDDGSGPLRIFLGAALGAETDGLDAGAWVEVTGVLGQETSGAQPLRGYRVWPRTAGEVRVTAPSQSDGPSAGQGDSEAGDPGGSAGDAPSAGLGDLEAPDLGSLTVGATLVHGSWPELGVGGLLWDGTRLVAVADASAATVDATIALAGSTPASVELSGLTASGREPGTGIPVVTLGTEAGDVSLRSAPADAPSGHMPRSGASWVSLVGRPIGPDDRPRLAIGTTGGAPALEMRCDTREGELPAGTVQVTGIGLVAPARIVVPCGGVRAAPTLARLTAASAPGTERSGAKPAPTGSLAATNDPGPARLGAALLLGVGAAVLGIAAAIGRRTDPEPDGDVDRLTGLRADAEEPEVEDTQLVPRALTLVALPREHESR